MNEQPYRDPAKPPTPDLRSREVLTKQVEDLQKTIAQAIVENNPKAATMASLHQNSVLMALLVDELQATQQMFERVDRRMTELPLAIRGQPAPSSVSVKEDGNWALASLDLTEEQKAAFRTVRGIFEDVMNRGKDDLLSTGTKLLLDALNEYNGTFVHAW